MLVVRSIGSTGAGSPPALDNLRHVLFRGMNDESAFTFHLETLAQRVPELNGRGVIGSRPDESLSLLAEFPHEVFLRFVVWMLCGLFHGYCRTISGMTSTVVRTDRPTRHCVWASCTMRSTSVCRTPPVTVIFGFTVTFVNR